MELYAYLIIFTIGVVVFSLLAYAVGYDRGSESAKDIMEKIQSELMEKLRLKASEILSKDDEILSKDAQIRAKKNEIVVLENRLAASEVDLKNEKFFADEFKKMHDDVVARYEEQKKESGSKSCSHGIFQEYNKLVDSLDLNSLSTSAKPKKKKAKNAKLAKRKR